MAFVMMPFAPEFDVVYYDAISPSLEHSGLTAMKADDFTAAGVIVEQIRTAIQNSRLCIADVTGANPNVMYEVGLAQSMGKSVILICQDVTTLPFDLSSLRVIQYDAGDAAGLSEALSPFIESVLSEGKFEEAERLIGMGMFAAAVSVLSVLLEQALRKRALETAETSRHDDVRRLALGRLVRQLQEAGSLVTPLPEELRRAVELRNSTVHGAIDPTKADAEFMLDVTRRVVRT